MMKSHFKIPPLTHACTILEGDLAGIKYRCEVRGPWDGNCPHCGEPLWDPEKALQHIYENLIEEGP